MEKCKTAIVHTPCHGAFPFSDSPYQKQIVSVFYARKSGKMEGKLSVPGSQEREQIDEQSTEHLQRRSSHGQAVFKRYIPNLVNSNPVMNKEIFSKKVCLGKTRRD